MHEKHKDIKKRELSLQPPPQIIFLVSRLLPPDRLHTAHELLKKKVSGLKTLSISIVPDCNLFCQISHAATLLIGSSVLVLVVVGPSAAALPSSTIVVTPPPPRQRPPIHGNFRDLLLVHDAILNELRVSAALRRQLPARAIKRPRRRRGGRHRRWSVILVENLLQA